MFFLWIAHKCYWRDYLKLWSRWLFYRSEGWNYCLKLTSFFPSCIQEASKLLSGVNSGIGELVNKQVNAHLAITTALINVDEKGRTFPFLKLFGRVGKIRVTIIGMHTNNKTLKKYTWMKPTKSFKNASNGWLMGIEICLQVSIFQMLYNKIKLF